MFVAMPRCRAIRVARFTESLGTAATEFAVCALVVLSVIILFWNEWARQELTQSVLAAAMSTLNDRTLPDGTPWYAFTVDAGGSSIPFDASDPVQAATLTNTLQSLGNSIINDLKSDSGYSATAQNLRCAVQLGYLSIETSSTIDLGKVLATPILFPIAPVVSLDSGVSSTTFGDISKPENAALAAKITQFSTDYYQSAQGKKLIGGSGKVQLLAGGPVQQIVFPYSAFVVWGCAAKSPVIGETILGEMVEGGISITSNEVA